MHEHFTDFATTTIPSNKNFGLTMAWACSFFAMLCQFKLHSNPLVITMFVVLSCVLLFLTIFKQDSLTKLNALWAALGIQLHKLVTPIIMLCIYATVFVPIGLILRVAGKSTKLKYNKGNQSFWIKKTTAELPEPMKYQF